MSQFLRTITQQGRKTIGLYADGLVRDIRPLEETDWRALLSGRGSKRSHLGTTEPRLSFRSSEARLFQRLHRLGVKQVAIRPRIDVDSFFARLQRLDAVRPPFMICLTPHFIHHITQDSKVSPGGHAPSKYKHVLFGRSRAAQGLSVFVVFAHERARINTKRGESPALPNDLIARWYEEIVRPAIQTTWGSRRMQEYPANFREAQNQSRAKQRHRATSDGTREIEIWKELPPDRLREFWEDVRRRCRSRREDFPNPLLWVEGHDFKVGTQGATAVEAVQRFLDRIVDSGFAFNPQTFDYAETWLDLGIEHFPECSREGLDPCQIQRLPALSLFWNSHCLAAHVDAAREAEGVMHPPETYPWHFCRDVGSNVLFAPKIGLPHVKFYQKIKKTFTSPVSRRYPFYSNPLLESVGFTQETIERAFLLNSHVGGNGDRGDQRNSALRSLLTNRRHATENIEANIRQDFGIRQEYRLLFGDLLATMSRQDERTPNDGDDVTSLPLDGGSWMTRDYVIDVEEYVEGSPSRPTRCPPHPKFTVVDTLHCQSLVDANLKRLSLVVEYLAARTTSRHVAGHHTPTLVEQINHSYMVAAVIRCLRIFINGDDPTRMPELWRREWQRREWKKRAHGWRFRSPGRDEDDGVDGDASIAETERTSEEDGPRSRRRGGRIALGLAMEEAVAVRGMAFFDADMLAVGQPLFDVAIAPRLALANNGLFRGLRCRGGILKQFVVDDHIAQLVTEACRQTTPAPTWLYWQFRPPRIGSGGWTPYRRHHSALRVAAEVVIACFVATVFRRITNVYRRRPGPAPQASRRFRKRLAGHGCVLNGFYGLSPRLIQQATGASPYIVRPRSDRQGDLWVDKLRPLFSLDSPPDQQPTWDRWEWRQLERQLRVVIRRELGETAAAVFPDVVCAYASRHLLLVPHFHSRELVQCRHRKGRREPQWIQPTIPVRYELFRRSDSGGPRWTSPFVDALSNLYTEPPTDRLRSEARARNYLQGSVFETRTVQRDAARSQRDLDKPGRVYEIDDLSRLGVESRLYDAWELFHCVAERRELSDEDEEYVPAPEIPDDPIVDAANWPGVASRPFHPRLRAPKDAASAS